MRFFSVLPILSACSVLHALPSAEKFYQAVFQQDYAKAMTLQGRLDTSDSTGLTTLMMVSEDGQVRLMARILAANSRPEFVNSREREGYTALSFAAQTGKRDAVRILLQRGADATIGDKAFGTTPLQFAAAKGHLDVVQEILAHQPGLLNAGNRDRNTPLIFASMSGQEDVVSYLLSNRDCDVRLQDADGLSALSGAAAFGHERIVRLLLERYDPNVISTEVVMALGAAIRHNFPSIESLIRSWSRVPLSLSIIEPPQ